MLGAYMSYVQEYSAANQCEPPCHGHLWDIVHRQRATVFSLFAQELDYAGLAWHQPCAARGCARCEEGRGGYQFRWYSAAWGAIYNRGRRPGAWKAPELGVGHGVAGRWTTGMETLDVVVSEVRIS